jgi:hypothetical protein
MTLIALLFASSLTFSPDLPDRIPSTDTWEVKIDETFERRIAEDVFSLGTRLLQFVQIRGVCPEELRAHCTYRVKHELRQVVEDKKLKAFVQRYVVLGPTGVRAEGVSYFSWENGNPILGVYFRWEGHWVREHDLPELKEAAMDFLNMLMQRHQS